MLNEKEKYVLFLHTINLLLLLPNLRAFKFVNQEMGLGCQFQQCTCTMDTIENDFFKRGAMFQGQDMTA